MGYMVILYWDNGKENGNYHLGFWVLELGAKGLGFKHLFGTRGLYWDIGIMEKKMETTI